MSVYEDTKNVHPLETHVNPINRGFRQGILFSINTIDIMIKGRVGYMRAMKEDSEIYNDLRQQVRALVVAKQTLKKARKGEQNA